MHQYELKKYMVGYLSAFRRMSFSPIIYSSIININSMFIYFTFPVLKYTKFKHITQPIINLYNNHSKQTKY